MISERPNRNGIIFKFNLLLTNDEMNLKGFGMKKLVVKMSLLHVIKGFFA